MNHSQPEWQSQPLTLSFGEEITYFADLILPVPIPKLFTYRVPRDMVEALKIGARVIVPFGKNRVYTAVVSRIHTHPPTNYQARYILELLDEYPLVTSYQLELFQWMADYYLCNVGDVLNCALPSGLKITSQSKVQYNPDFDHPDLLTEAEKPVLEELKKHPALSYEELGRLVGETNVPTIIKSLIGKRAVIVFEEVREKYVPKMVRKVRLHTDYEARESLLALIGKLDKLPKQQEALMRYLRYIPVQNNPALNSKGLDKSMLNQDDELSQSSLQTLIKNGVFETFEVIMPRFSDDNTPTVEVRLTETQQSAVSQIMGHFAEKDIALLHGITGSGKTEVYINLIQQVLDSGSQVLYLLPEIALTTQIVVRLQKVFGDKMGIYHSKFSDNERVEVWKGVISGQYQFVVGVRSSVFLPFDNLGLIIVDEEHETSYKQHDPAPRYHARDVAMVVARRQGAKVLLGSATPSVDSYHHATEGRYGLVELLQRYGDAQLPEIVLVNTRIEKQKRLMKNEFSSVLLDAIQANLERGEQSILFQNRRGYSPYIQCEECEWIAQCGNCAVSLTYHMRDAEIRCHYCGHRETVPKVCPACGSPKVRTIGFGTEKLEDQLQILFPQARIQRMDLDTTRSKNAYQQIIQEFEKGGVDILVGTQMISKGLDFDKVSLVGIFDADRMIHFPEFRATERSFQMITQVSGRAGRRADRRGRVIIQTSNPQQNVLLRVLDNDYKGLFEEEIEERRNYNYPPFSRLIKLTVRHAENNVSQQAAQRLTDSLAEKLGGSRVLGPEKPLVERIRNQYLYDIVVKLERSINAAAAKAFIQEQITDILADKGLKAVTVVADVDCL